MKLRQFLNSDVVTLLLSWRYGPLILIAGWVFAHVLVGYELITGKMRLRWSLEWIEGRESAPVMYWIYVGASVAGLLLIDAFVVWPAIKTLRKKEPIQLPETTRGK